MPIIGKADATPRAADGAFFMVFERFSAGTTADLAAPREAC
jgi:hypothetical protein